MDTLIWYVNNIMGQLVQMLPCMALALVIWSAVRPLRLRKLSKSGLSSGKAREAVLLCFVLFCTGLCALTLFPYGFWRDCLRALWEPGYRPRYVIPTLEQSLAALRELPGSMTPFREIVRVHYGGPWLWFVLWGNIGMFVPIGFLVSALWRGGWYRAVLVGFGFSLAIEFIQVFVGRVSDIDDIMLNTAGSLVGFFLYFICCKVLKFDMSVFHCHAKEEV